MIVTVILVLAVVLIIVMNRNNTATVWFFNDFKDISVLWLIVITAVVSVIARWIIGGVYRAWKELKEAQTQDAVSAAIKKSQASEKEPDHS
jgi:membrane protein YdbS with pleckstrin-like domain